MTIWVRNFNPPDVADQYGDRPLLTYVRELLLVARWTEHSNNGDAAWTSNIVVSPVDLQVDPTNPRRITSLSNPFTSGMVGYSISLFAANDQNRGLWRIIKYIDANNIEVDQMGFTPWNWILEAGISGRVIRMQNWLAAGAWSLMSAPTGNMQARLLYNATNDVRFYVRPKGLVPLATECTGFQFAQWGAMRRRMHMVAENQNALLYWHSEDTPLAVLFWGKLEDEDAADTDPNFLLGGDNTSGTQLNDYAMYMLNGADADIRMYVTALKRNWSVYTSTANTLLYPASRLVNAKPGYAPVRSPWVMMDNVLTVGACIRGRLPLVGQTYRYYERLRPLDAAGDWLHLYNGFAVPRNGPNDQLPMVPV